MWLLPQQAIVAVMGPSRGVLRVCASEGVDPDCGRGELSEQVGVVSEEGMCWGRM